MAETDQPQSGEEMDVPSEVGDILGLLFEALQDRVRSLPLCPFCLLSQSAKQDTIVRWSAAKGVARIAERLPRDLCSEVFETVLGLFEVHWFEAGGLYSLPAIAEGTWHGACLACAEIARRSLVEPQRLPELIGWLSKVRWKKHYRRVIAIFIHEQTCRLCISISGRELTRLGRTSVMLLHMSSGRSPGRRTNLL